MKLTNEQLTKAREWYMNHSEHVLNLFDIAQEEDVCYSPSAEDVSFTNLWKPAHWAWFMINHVFHEDVARFNNEK